MTQEEVEILNRTITNKVIELVKTTVKSPKQNPNTRWIYWWILLSVLRININISYSSEKKRGILPTSFCETNILILKPNKKLTRKENDRAISLMNIDTNILSKILSKQIEEKVNELGALGWLSRLSLCLRLRSWSQGPGIETCIRLSALWGACFLLSLSACLSAYFWSLSN